MTVTGMKLSKRMGLGKKQIKNKQNPEVYKEFSSENGQSPLCFLFGKVCSQEHPHGTPESDLWEGEFCYQKHLKTTRDFRFAHEDVTAMQIAVPP